MIYGTTKIYGILGDPVEHSLSPVMQNAAFAACGIDAAYVPFHVAATNLPAAVAGLRSLNVVGFNVTIPHKEEVGALLDEVDGAAAVIGAVNTVVRCGDKLIGYNTDGEGLLRSLAIDLNFIPVATSNVVIVGAGGAARAAVYVLAQQGVASITIINRTLERAQALVDHYSSFFPRQILAAAAFDSENDHRKLTKYFKGCDLIINSTSIGLFGESFNVIQWDSLRSASVVYDMVYGGAGKIETPLVATAKAAGFDACNGLGMLAEQGEAAFELWTSRKSGGVMRGALVDCVDKIK